MYSNERKNGFSLLDLLVKIIFAALFIFLLIWLFNKKMPNMKAVYSNQFRENIKFMQDAGEAYFTDDKMPTTPGESKRLTLQEMENMNLVLPFVDKDGKACNKKDSYVSVTKLEDTEGYELKTYLVCGKEKNYIVKTLGCHNYCGNACNKTCTISKETEYEFKKLVEGSKTNYSCPKGYTLKGSTCYKTNLKDSKSALVTTTETRVITVPAEVIKGDATLTPLAVVKSTKDVELPVNKSTKDVELPVNKSTKEVELAVNKSTKEVELTVVKNTKDVELPAKSYNETESYTCTKTRTENQCKTESKRVAYSCDCGIRYVDDMPVYSCNTCYKTVQETTCHDVEVPYTTTCTRSVTKYKCPSNATKQSGSGSSLKCYKTETTYSCPSNTTRSTGSGSSLKCYRTETTYSCPSNATRSTGSGSSLKCYRTETTYSCPSNATKSTGSGSSLKCYKTETTYSCPSNATKSTGSGSSLKCYKTETTYSCPSGTDVQEGSGANLKCYKVVAGSVSYKCKDSSYKLVGTNCTKTVTETVTKKECKLKGYVLEGDKCNLYETQSQKATGKTEKTSSYKYTWAKTKTLEGWTPTGKTREVDGKEICK